MHANALSLHVKIFAAPGKFAVVFCRIVTSDVVENTIRRIDMRKCVFGFTVVSALLAGSQAMAAALAADTASDPAYNSGFNTGTNGGAGFGAFTIVRSVANQGFSFISSSDNNGSEDGTNGDIDTAGESFGLAVGDGGSIRALRDFTGGPLTVGQTFTLGIDNGFINSGGVVGFSLRSGTTDRFTFSFTGGETRYKVNGVATSFGFTTDGLRVAVTLTATDNFSATVTRLAGGEEVVVGSLAGTGDLTGFSFINNNAGYGGSASNDAFFNSPAVTGAVPEPATMALLGLGMLASLRRRR
jgi:hypothetical protein